MGSSEGSTHLDTKRNSFVRSIGAVRPCSAVILFLFRSWGMFASFSRFRRLTSSQLDFLAPISVRLEELQVLVEDNQAW